MTRRLFNRALVAGGWLRRSLNCTSSDRVDYQAYYRRALFWPLLLPQW